MVPVFFVARLAERGWAEMSREHEFDPKSFKVSQLAYRLKISTSGAYALLVDLIEMGAAQQVGRGRYAFEFQSKTAKIRREG